MKVLITGGAGFIGCNLTERMLQDGHHAIVLDNLSRPGAEDNQHWLSTRGRYDFIRADVTDADAMTEALRIHTPDAVIHLAGQVAVTTSVTNPRDDFMANALGTFNVLEAVRTICPDSTLIYASTNKVYGKMENTRTIEQDGRYVYQDYPEGISEETPLDFHSPYGCSKGAGDQYVRDYARIYGLRTVVFRQSCIYGPRQMGMEDQGWLAWFAIAVLTGQPISIFGDGRQVRDVLYIEDLIEAYLKALDGIDEVAGEVFNIGGGPDFAVSVWTDFGPILERIFDQKIPVTYDDWRPGDQYVFISNIQKAQRLLDWAPRTNPEEGITQMVQWIKDHKSLFM